MTILRMKCTKCRSLVVWEILSLRWNLRSPSYLASSSISVRYERSKSHPLRRGQTSRNRDLGNSSNTNYCVRNHVASSIRRQWYRLIVATHKAYLFCRNTGVKCHKMITSVDGETSFRASRCWCVRLSNGYSCLINCWRTRSLREYQINRLGYQEVNPHGRRSKAMQIDDA